MDVNSLLVIVAILAAAYYVKNYVFAPAPAPVKKVVKQNSYEAKRANPKFYTAEEVSVHNKETDLWLIIDGKVYDVTPYVDKHMGGMAIMNNAGKDSSKGFHGDQHPVKVQQILDEFYIGELKQ
ncbi:hypothetical protein PPL_00925 [Heterostelium album PN500]|uniref:Cytochrome b5 heme-binding domain-containing protein n=1 Tax=Heterostelium pallidum (strain ATCC 26659 / Pp 5 / PN500) TaxID=670386 RepID=D3AXL9_HETP5|nr:hypothetical protein PPL_00925 [Heterostelium album PN500]EFA85696.1 hypothetical protein PPL_00925 [Heterostelium album PN500]|eukprot:XP_020437802.1 hypothetical protein PPL_00925 [Heterostelium album PN500]